MDEKLRDWLTEQGFTPNELARGADHRAIAIAEKAMRADRALQARNAKRAAAALDADRRRQEASERLRRTGKHRDAVSLIEEMLNH